MENNNQFKTRQDGRIIGGFILVAIGAALLLRNLGFDLPHWLFSWPVILILIGVYTGFKHNFKNNAWIILMGIGTFFLVSKFIPELGLKPFFWPIIIIGAGILFMFRPSRFNNRRIHHNDNFNKWKSNMGTNSYASDTYTGSDSNDFVEVNSVFSGVKKNVISKNFKGGRISSNFGGAEIDCSLADMNEPAIIKMDVVFGGVKIIVPPHWVIQNELEGMFHGMDDKRRYQVSATANTEKILILKGSVVFGGVEIRSY